MQSDLRSTLLRAFFWAPFAIAALGRIALGQDTAAPKAEARETAGAPEAKEESTDVGTLENLRSRTLGGVMLWGDVLWFRQWHIQKHAVIGHFRLLDAADKRLTWGSYETCLTELERIKQAEHLEPMRGKVVVLLHGLGGFRGTMQPLGDYLRDQGKYQIINVAYPSTLGDIGAHAKALAGIIDQLPEVEELYFVAHSLGNLVVRHYLGDLVARTGKQDPRIKRMVMLAPPNHGAERARALADSELFGIVLGDSAVQLGARWDSIEPKLATPTFEFGIIAGGRGDDKGYLSGLPGDNDGILSVATTRLDGARDFVLVPVMHPLTMLNATVKQYTLTFLEKGYFISAEKRQPILPEKTAPEKTVTEKAEK
jgi:pimeloyl-ACP methyl ester carboxylesterase